MKRKRIPAIMVAMGLLMGSAGVNAAQVLPNGPDIGVFAKFSTAVATIFDEFEIGHSGRSTVEPAMDSVDIFAGPYQLMVTGSDERDSSGMIMASLGLMALIAYRRRTI